MSDAEEAPPVEEEAPAEEAPAEADAAEDEAPAEAEAAPEEAPAEAAPDAAPAEVPDQQPPAADPNAVAPAAPAQQPPPGLNAGPAHYPAAQQPPAPYQQPPPAYAPPQPGAPPVQAQAPYQHPPPVQTPPVQAQAPGPVYPPYGGQAPYGHLGQPDFQRQTYDSTRVTHPQYGGPGQAPYQHPPPNMGQQPPQIFGGQDPNPFGVGGAPPGMGQPMPMQMQMQPQPPQDPGMAGFPQGTGGIQPNPNVAMRIQEDAHEMYFLDPYNFVPERVDYVDIPNVNQMRTLWANGMREVEDVFSRHIQKMNMDFESKAMGFENVQRKIQVNMSQMHNVYKDMQNMLNEKYRGIKVERDAWEIEKSGISSLVKIDSEVVSLNVGGTHHIQTEKDVLRSVPESILAKMFSDMHQLKTINGEVFLDRDGKSFNHVVNYLRNDRKVYPEFVDKNEHNQFIKELHFWGIDSHRRKEQEQILRPLNKSVHIANFNARMEAQRDIGDIVVERRSPRQNQTFTPKQPETLSMHRQGLLQQQMNYRRPSSESGSDIEGQEMPSYMKDERDEEDERQPGTALKTVKDKWAELGPLKLEEIVQNSDTPIDQGLQFGQSRYNKFIIGQIGFDGRVQGVGKEINHIIYEGQFKNDVYHGFGRYIYANGNFYVGQWIDGKRSGWGKLVDTSGKVYEGMWQYSKFLGQ